MVMPRSFSDDRYGWVNATADIPASVDAYELPDVRVPKKRRKNSDAESDLGFKLSQAPPGVEWDEHPLKVAFVRPGRSADRGGLKAGDTIVSVDGHDVTGAQRYLYSSLTSVTVGTTLRFGLDEGGTAEITAAPPP
jgi:S1-C subfamily serine protease